MAVTFSREGGTGWDASEATRLVRAAVRTTPTTRMAPSRSNFPYPAPIIASKHEEKAVASGRSNGDPAMGILSPSFRALPLRGLTLGTAYGEASVPRSETSMPIAYHLAREPLDRKEPIPT